MARLGSEKALNTGWLSGWKSKFVLIEKFSRTHDTLVRWLDGLRWLSARRSSRRTFSASLPVDREPLSLWDYMIIRIEVRNGSLLNARGGTFSRRLRQDVSRTGVFCKVMF